MRHLPALIFLGLLAFATRPLRAAGGAPPGPPAVDYVTAVKPILAGRCYTCHGALRQKAGLRLDAGPLIRKGSDNGPVVAPGRPDESPLIDAVTGAHDAKRMPNEGAPLSAEQVAVLKTWVAQGAKVAEEPTPPGPREHWSFRPPVRPAVPAPKDPADAAWVRNPVDAFLAAEYEKRGLPHAPQADRATLLRRVYLDLIGLPPDRRQVKAFLEDPSPDAYEKVVDDLLASPRYGERWGRHWLDVWRYSDWAGYGAEVRDSQPFVWRWRDWVIESLNADVPYDRMTTDMLAADEAEPGDASALRATGYLARDYYKFNRNVWMDAAVEHTGKAFLGLTLNCARCHDHKFDPISQKEYYRFRAVFEPYDVRIDRVPGEPDVKKDGMTRVFDKDADRPTYLFVRGNDKNPATDAPLSAGVPAALGGELGVEPVRLPPEAYYPGLTPIVRDEALASARAEVEKSRASLAGSEPAPAAARHEAGAGAPASEPAETAAAGPFLADNFSSARPALWATGPGRWEYRGGRLVQSQTGPAERGLVSRADAPRDFTARFRFVITGGEQWKSVGISFDCDETGSREAVSAYLSAHDGGKAQVYFRRAGFPTYPAEAIAGLAVAVGREYLLRVDVRGELVNVYADDVPVVAYRLPAARRPGKFSVWAFDASAEFLGVRVEPLGTGVKLAEPGAAVTVAPAADPARAGAHLATAEAALAAVEARVAADRARYAEPPAADAGELALAAGRAERRAAVAAAEEAVLAAGRKPDATALAGKRKALEDARAALEKPSPAYTPLGEVYPATSTGRRLALARWVVDRRNPLTARVAVNHIWMRHFGEPLVPTVFDFGLNGRPPTHPELLDWLAVELMEPTAASGPGARPWAMKSLHRLIVTSAAYRMASSAPADAAGQAIDPDNHFLWRMNARRMEAEVVRDAVLSVAGRLDPKAGGPDLDPAAGMTNFRRSVWFRTANEKQMGFLQVFDAPSPTECYRRSQSVVPQQALALANSPLSLAMSRSLAGDLSREVGPADHEASDQAFVAAAFGQVLGRDPTAAEREACGRFLSEQAERLKDGTKLTRFGGEAGGTTPAADPRQRAREGLVHVLLNHNDFVMVR